MYYTEHNDLRSIFTELFVYIFKTYRFKTVLQKILNFNRSFIDLLKEI